MADWGKWNELVKSENVIETTKKSRRTSSITKPTHIIIHITGVNDLESVKKTFLKSVSAHYLIDKQGELYQFVRDKDKAWHAGIQNSIRRLYRRKNMDWLKYLWYFSWYRGYPDDVVFLDADLKTVWDNSEAAFVMNAAGEAWDHYNYFTQRWPERESPINFENNPDPNNYSIGIECLSIGSTKPKKSEYTDEMYHALDALIDNLVHKYDIPRKKGFIVGHEDVNPMARFGWDPNSGFEWSNILS